VRITERMAEPTRLAHLDATELPKHIRFEEVY